MIPSSPAREKAAMVVFPMLQDKRKHQAPEREHKLRENVVFSNANC
jgi:hypothetical protein